MCSCLPRWEIMFAMVSSWPPLLVSRCMPMAGCSVLAAVRAVDLLERNMVAAQAAKLCKAQGMFDSGRWRGRRRPRCATCCRTTTSEVWTCVDSRARCSRGRGEEGLIGALGTIVPHVLSYHDGAMMEGMQRRSVVTKCVLVWASGEVWGRAGSPQNR